MAERVFDPKERNYKALILLLGDGPFEGRELAEFLACAQAIRSAEKILLQHPIPIDQ